MRGYHDDDTSRRSVVPTAARRALWPAAIWTGAGAPLVAALLGILAVAICWLPVAGTDNRVHSTVHAGLLSFLAALHGGITVDATPASFLPLGLLLILASIAWRAGSGLADAAAELDERDPSRLALAGLVQVLSFALTCLLAVPFASLGTSGAPAVEVAIAAVLLCTVSGGIAFVRASPLAQWFGERVPIELRRGARSALAGLAVYLAAGAVLVAGSLLVHHGRVEALSRQVGGGWGAVPVLLLGVLAAPNAVIAGVSYLAGPGFAVGTGTAIGVASTAHGTVPSFPLLGALPDGHGANALGWVLVIVTPIAAGAVVARLAGRRGGGWASRLREVGVAAVLAGVAMAVLAWQGGGGIGDGPLRTIGAPPAWTGLAVALEIAAAAAVVFAAIDAWHRVAGWAETHRSSVQNAVESEPKPSLVVVSGEPDDAGNAEGADELAG